MQKSTGRFNTPLQQLFLLEQRVRQAGVRLPDEADDELRFHGIKCIIDGNDCVINLRTVAEVIDDRGVTPIPGTEDWVEGVMNYRGILVPVYRPEKFLAGAAGAGTGTKSPAPENCPLMVIKKDRRGNEFNAIRVNKVIGMQKFRTMDLALLESAGDSDRSLEYFTDEKINTEEKSWFRVDVTRLIEAMADASMRKH